MTLDVSTLSRHVAPARVAAFDAHRDPATEDALADTSLSATLALSLGVCVCGPTPGDVQFRPFRPLQPSRTLLP